MTLIITELSEYGIAMVADSAVTFSEVLPSGVAVHRVLNGALKLQVIPYLNAGISVWGFGSLPKQNGGLISTDIWLSDFIQQNSDIDSLDNFANTLVAELQGIVGHVQSYLGFHLAGYVTVNGEKLPTFYHVRNVDGDFQNYQLHEFISGQDFPPQKLENGNAYITRNGDYGTYAILAGVVQQVLPIIHQGIGIEMPYPSLRGRMSYLAAWVRFVSELYASSQLLKTIGGNIAVLGVTPEEQIISLPST